VFEFMQAPLDVGFLIIDEENPHDPSPVGSDTTGNVTLMIWVCFILKKMCHRKLPSCLPEPVRNSLGRLVELVRIPLDDSLRLWAYWRLFHIEQVLILCPFG